jgi:hypothetical protein
MMKYFTEVCVESTICFILKPQKLSRQTSSKAKQSPAASGDQGICSLAAAAGRFNRNPRGERATGTTGLAFVSFGLPCFLPASGHRRKGKNRETCRSKKQRKRLISP